MKTRVCLKYFVNDCSLKSTVDELDINKLKIVPTDLSRLSHVDNDVDKKNLYIELVKKH